MPQGVPPGKVGEPYPRRLSAPPAGTKAGSFTAGLHNAATPAHARLVRNDKIG